jgi:hypothetical protein
VAEGVASWKPSLAVRLYRTKKVPIVRKECRDITEEAEHRTFRLGRLSSQGEDVRRGSPRTCSRTGRMDIGMAHDAISRVEQHGKGSERLSCRATSSERARRSGRRSTGSRAPDRVFPTTCDRLHSNWNGLIEMLDELSQYGYEVASNSNLLVFLPGLFEC